MLTLNWKKMVSELLYADGIVMMSESIKGLMNKFR